MKILLKISLFNVIYRKKDLLMGDSYIKLFSL